MHPLQNLQAQIGRVYWRLEISHYFVYTMAIYKLPEAVMKNLLFMVVVMIGVYETSSGMLPQSRCDFTGAFDLSAIISEVNRLKKQISPDRVFQLKSSIVEKQRLFRTMHQNLLVARCKFIQATLMVHSKEMPPSSSVISKAAMLLLEAAEEGDTDAQEVILASTKKSTMGEVASLERNIVLDSIRERITSPMVIKNNFLRQYVVKGVIDRLAAIAACDDSCDINAIVPLRTTESLNDSILTNRRNRFQMLIGGMLLLLTEDDQSAISGYVSQLDQEFQQSQLEEFGVSIYENIKFDASSTIIPEGILCATGGIPEILATTPDIAFSNLKDSRKQDFKTVVEFIKTVRLLAKVNTSKLEEVVDSLLVFADKWNDFAIETYLQAADSNSKIEAKEYVKSIRQIIEELR